MAGALKKGILFDFDDTLVETTVYFDMAKARFAELMTGLGFPASEALVKLNEFDIRNVCRAGGFFKECFPQALGETYEYYCQQFARRVSPAIKQKAEAMGWWVFEQPPEIISGAEEVVQRMAGDFFLVLATKGDPDVQKERLRKTDLEQYFQAVYILPDKTDEIYKKIFIERRLSRESSWVIGNSMKGDINPAIRLSINCIHVYHRHTWDFEEEIAAGEHFAVKNIKEVPQIIYNGKL